MFYSVRSRGLDPQLGSRKVDVGVRPDHTVGPPLGRTPSPERDARATGRTTGSETCADDGGAILFYKL